MSANTFNVPQFSSTPRIIQLKPDYEIHQQLTPQQLQDKTDELELRLGAVECENDGLQDQMKLLQREKEKLLSEVEAGAASLSSQQQHYQKLYIQYKKTNKAVQGLNAYLETLPLPEELTTLKTQVGEQNEKMKLLETKCEVLQSDLSDERENNAIYSEQLLQCNHHLDDYKRRTTTLRDELSQIQERKATAESLGELQVDDVMWERDRLHEEKKNTAKLLLSFKKKVSSLEERIESVSSEMEEKLQQMSRELQLTNEKLHQEQQSNISLTQDIKQKSSALCAVEAELSLCRGEQEDDVAVWGVRNTLYSEVLS